MPDEKKPPHRAGRGSIREAIEQVQEEQRRELFRARMEIARKGIKSFENRKVGDAVRAFHTYLRILEESKGVAEGGLHPLQFDPRKDAAELMVISGIYWDLAKLYDRTVSSEKQQEFRDYLEKFVIFSKGTPFQGLSAETVRKHISYDRPKNLEAFREAYRTLSTSRCFVATSLADVSDPATLPALRRFRDDVLQRSRAGRAFVRWYYRRGPAIADFVDRWPGFARRGLARGLDAIALVLSPRRR